MTLKYNQGLKLNEYYPHAKFDIYHIYGVLENRKSKVLPHMDTRQAGLTLMDIDSHFSCESKKEKKRKTEINPGTDL